jgi:hypothetical protein
MAELRRLFMRTSDKIALGVALGLVAAVAARELRKPAGERQWHGTLAGVVPYDLRPPTPDRIRRKVWNPEDPRLLTEHAFGIGWSVNLARLAGLVRNRTA